jgi:azurin
MNRVLFRVILGAAVIVSPCAGSEAGARQSPPPRILLDQTPRAIEYQLSRLTNDELQRVERKPDDPKYRLVYVALLTRKGLPRPVRDEAVAALTALDKASPTKVVIDALAKVAPEDDATGGQMLAILLGQPADALRSQRATLEQAAGAATEPWVLRGAYAGLLIADGDPDRAWAAAVQSGHTAELLHSIPLLGTNADALRPKLFTPIAALLAGTPDAATRIEAVTALGWTRRDAATFDLLAREVVQGTDPQSREAAIRALQLLPEAVWPKDKLEPLAQAVLTLVKGTPADQRTDPAFGDIVQFGERLSAALPGESGRSTLRELRAMGIRVIRVSTVPEQMLFDVKWFVVEAAKPVQVLLTNTDTMPHNFVVGKPGSVKEIGTAAAMVPLPSDPNAKAYVPDSPLVLQATRLINGGENERLNFTAPSEPGEYVYLCSFPGHWLRMYGVMLVVPSLEGWEAKKTIPTDPLTGKPFASER